MSKLFFPLTVAVFILFYSNGAHSHGPMVSDSQYGFAFRWQADPIVSHALGGSYAHGPGWDLDSSGWYSMNREDSEKLKEIRNTFQKETLDLRKQLLAKQMDLATLWAQQSLKSIEVEKLSKEIARLQGELVIKRSQHLIRCRQQFGGQNWTCPGIWLQTKIPE